MPYFGLHPGRYAHWAAGVRADNAPALRPMMFTEDAEGYARLLEVLSRHGADCVCVAEHSVYGRNLSARLRAEGHPVWLVPFVLHEEHGPSGAHELAQQARRRGHAPAPELCAQDWQREILEAHQAALLERRASWANELETLVALSFPELPLLLPCPDDPARLAVLEVWPGAEALRLAPLQALASLRVEGGRVLGTRMAHRLHRAAWRSVAAHHGEIVEGRLRFAARALRAIEAELEGVRAALELRTLRALPAHAS